MKTLDAKLMARVQAVLDARARLPCAQQNGARPRLQVEPGEQATDLLIYDEISWWGICAQDVVDALADIKGNVNVRINSPGGDVFDGIAIFNTLRSHNGQVTVTIDGLAASAASVIAMAGDTVRMNTGTQLMIHDALTMLYGNAADFTEIADLLNRVSDNIASIYADRTGVDLADWRDRMRAETWYSAQEAVDAGLADELATSRHAKNEDAGQEPDMAARYDLTVFRFAGRDKAPAPPVNTAVGPHDGTAKEGTWDASAEQGKLPSPMPVATARKMYALYDGDKVEDGKIVKGACSLPHHFVSDDGTPGAPSLNGVNNALSRLSQTQGYSEEEKATAERHLRGHKPSGDGEDHADPHMHAEGETPAAAGTDPIDPEPAPGGEAEPTEPAEPDDWAVATAHLNPGDPDEEFASLTEALL